MAFIHPELKSIFRSIFPSNLLETVDRDITRAYTSVNDNILAFSCKRYGWDDDSVNLFMAQNEKFFENFILKDMLNTFGLGWAIGYVDKSGIQGRVRVDIEALIARFPRDIKENIDRTFNTHVKGEIIRGILYEVIQNTLQYGSQEGIKYYVSFPKDQDYTLMKKSSWKFW